MVLRAQRKVVAAPSQKVKLAEKKDVKPAKKRGPENGERELVSFMDSGRQLMHW